MSKSKYTDQDLIKAVQSSSSIRQVLAKLGLSEAGGNYSITKRRIQKLDLKTTHFKGQGWKKGNHNPVVSAKPLSEILRKGVVFQSFKLKRRLFAEGLKEKNARCA
jgi:hypothetical protein